SQAMPGDLDPTFGQRGIVTTAVAPGFSAARAVAIEPDGRLVVAGRSHSPADGANDSRYAVGRYLPTGRRDSSFGERGVFIVPDAVGSFDIPNVIAIQPDGKILLAGVAGTAFGTEFGLARLNSNGVLDATFGDGGLVANGIPLGLPQVNMGGSSV